MGRRIGPPLSVKRMLYVVSNDIDLHSPRKLFSNLRQTTSSQVDARADTCHDEVSTMTEESPRRGFSETNLYEKKKKKNRWPKVIPETPSIAKAVMLLDRLVIDKMQ